MKEKFNLIEALELMRKGKKLTFDYQRDTTKYYFVKNDELWFKTKSGEEISVLSIFRIDAKEWEIYEEPKLILDTEEKAYLEAVLRPFKNKITHVTKHRYLGIKKEYIDFNGDKKYLFSLPFFDLGTMYKGMEPDKEYTLEELGLFDRKIY